MQSPNNTQNPPLTHELRILRASLRRAKTAMKNNPNNTQKAGLLIARLTNSISRLTLAQQKLLSSPASTPQADWDNALRTYGLGGPD
jgi:hypothetical protein